MDTTVSLDEEDDFDYEAGTEVFRTRRCIVRQIRLSDLKALYRIYAQPGVKDTLEELYEWEEEVAYTKTYIRMIYGFYGYGMWIVEEKKTGEVIGRVGFDDREVEDGTGKMRRILEFGYLIAPGWQKRGIGTEVCRKALQFLFRHFEEEMVTCLIEPGNCASACFAQKIGFLPAGSLMLGGKQMDIYEYRKRKSQKGQA